MARAAPEAGAVGVAEGQSREAGAVLGGGRWISLGVAVAGDPGGDGGGGCGVRWGRVLCGVGAGLGH